MFMPAPQAGRQEYSPTVRDWLAILNHFLKKKNKVITNKSHSSSAAVQILVITNIYLCEATNSETSINPGKP